MRFSTLTLLALATKALGLAIPLFPHHASHYVSDTPVNRGPNVALALFSVPCSGCFPDANEEMVFKVSFDSTTVADPVQELELRTLSSEHACDPSSIFVNGVRLTLDKDVTAKQGTLVFDSKLTSGANLEKISSTWEMSCIDSELSTLSMTINSVPGVFRPSKPAGFSIFIRHANTPEYLRLKTRPSHDTSDPSSVEEWRHVDENSDHTFRDFRPSIDKNMLGDLQEQLLRLYEAKAQMGKWHHESARQDRQILEAIKHDVDTCKGAKCVLKTTMKKAPEFFAMIKAHFQDSTRVEYHGPWRGNPDRSDGIRAQGNSLQGFDNRYHEPVGSPLHCFGPACDETGINALLPPPEHGRFPIGHYPHPPPPPGHGFSAHDGQPPFPGHHRPDHHRPKFFHRHGHHHHKHSFVFSFALVFLVILLASLAFKCVRPKTDFVRNDRRRRDCAARREEFRSRVAYKKAAMRHRCKRWWSRLKQPTSTGDYEEKRARILVQENTLDNAIHTEIQDLRRAHEIVGDMMRAEENRQRLYHEANFDGSSRAFVYRESADTPDGESVKSVPSTLPPYQPPPPSYDQELEGELMVVDGFMYTPSNTDSTPESSVVDCNSRISFETDPTMIRDERE